MLASLIIWCGWQVAVAGERQCSAGAEASTAGPRLLQAARASTRSDAGQAEGSQAEVEIDAQSSGKKASTSEKSRVPPWLRRASQREYLHEALQHFNQSGDLQFDVEGLLADAHGAIALLTAQQAPNPSDSTVSAQVLDVLKTQSAPEIDKILAAGTAGAMGVNFQYYAKPQDARMSDGEIASLLTNAIGTGLGGVGALLGVITPPLISPVAGVAMAVLSSVLCGMTGVFPEEDRMTQVLQDLYQKVMADAKKLVEIEIRKNAANELADRFRDLASELPQELELLRVDASMKQARLAYNLLLQHELSTIFRKLFTNACLYDSPRNGTDPLSSKFWKRGEIPRAGGVAWRPDPFASASCTTWMRTGLPIALGRFLAQVHLNVLADTTMISASLTVPATKLMVDKLEEYRIILTRTVAHVRSDQNPIMRPFEAFVAPTLNFLYDLHRALHKAATCNPPPLLDARLHWIVVPWETNNQPTGMGGQAGDMFDLSTGMYANKDNINRGGCDWCDPDLLQSQSQCRMEKAAVDKLREQGLQLEKNNLARIESEQGTLVVAVYGAGQYFSFNKSQFMKLLGRSYVDQERKKIQNTRSKETGFATIFQGTYGLAGTAAGIFVNPIPDQWRVGDGFVLVKYMEVLDVNADGVFAFNLADVQNCLGLVFTNGKISYVKNTRTGVLDAANIYTVSWLSRGTGMGKFVTKQGAQWKVGDEMRFLSQEEWINEEYLGQKAPEKPCLT